MGRKLIHGDPAIFSQIRFDLAHLQHHGYDLRIDLHILGQKDLSSGELRFVRGLPGRYIFPLDSRFEFLQHCRGKQRLGNKAVYTCLQGIFQNIVPAVSGQDDDGGFIPDNGADLACRFNAVHFRHLPVDQDQIVRFPSGMAQPHHLNGLLPGSGILRGDPCFFQHQAGMFTGDRIVINDQHRHIVGMNLIVTVMSFIPIRVRERHRHNKSGAFAFLAFHLDVAVHHLHNIFRDGQAKAGTAVSAG